MPFRYPVFSQRVPRTLARQAAETLAAFLELQGYTVHLAGDGEEALDVAMRVTPIACFVDIGMPKMNGYEFARELRRRRGGRTALLVATTGWGQAEDRRRAMEAGFDVHMVKPIDLNEATRMLAARLSPDS
ncbi:response regulator [Rhizobacter sp. Root404]|uniref:response regulator n=1 Tax=Rhizobacter sp. Root404 TaxID=1736528 RepID=UPI0009EC14A0